MRPAESPRTLPAAIDSLRRLGGESLVRQMLRLFLDSAPRSLAALHDGITSDDASAVERAAHTLGTSAALVGACALEDVARRLEQTAEAGTRAGVPALVEELQGALRRTTEEVVAALEQLPEVPRVAVVEDSPDVRLLLRMILQGDFEVLEFESGVAALEALPGAGVDVVLLDISLPVLDGVQTLRLLRQSPALARLPVVAITAQASDEDQARFLSLGFDALFPKPLFDEDLLLDTLRRLVGAESPAG